MTYRQLKEFMSTFTDEQLDMDVTIQDQNEDVYYWCYDCRINNEDDVLDAGHPYLVSVRE